METELMHVHLEIPEELGLHLADGPVELARTALESLALEGIRSGKLTESQARRMLGIESRNEMDGFLKAHGVYPCISLEDVRNDSDTAAAFSR